MNLPSTLAPRASADHPAYNCPMDRLYNTLMELKGDFPMLVDLTAVDHGVDASPRFEVIYHLFSHLSHQYVRVASFCPPGPTPTAPSVVDLWPAANWHERECYDLMGITFTGHPELKRILMWDSYPYHPLRKDFPLAGIPTPLPAADVTEATGASVKAAPMMGGPFAAKDAGTMKMREPRAKDESWTERKEK